MDAAIPPAAATSAALDFAIRVEGVSHAFPSPDGKPVLALDDVSFNLPKGQFLALVGASGCGKSTMLNMAAGLVRPSAATVGVDGRGHQQAVAQDRIHVASDHLLPWRSARQNIEVALELAQKMRNEEGSARNPADQAGRAVRVEPILGNSRRACASAWRWPARSRSIPTRC